MEQVVSRLSRLPGVRVVRNYRSSDGVHWYFHLLVPDQKDLEPVLHAAEGSNVPVSLYRGLGGLVYWLRLRRQEFEMFEGFLS